MRQVIFLKVTKANEESLSDFPHLICRFILALGSCFELLHDREDEEG